MYVNGSEVVPVILPEQLSVAVGIVEIVAEHSSVTSGSEPISATGASFSVTVTSKEHVFVPHPLPIAKVTVVVPGLNAEPLPSPSPLSVVAPVNS